MLPVDSDLRCAITIRVARRDLLRLKWLSAATRFELALRHHRRALRLAYKYGYNPTEPRVSAGNTGAGEWTRLAGGTRTSGGLRGGFGAGSFPGSTYGQQVRLDLSMARMLRAVAQVRQYRPDWEPSTESAISNDGIEGVIRKIDARAEEAETRLDQLRRGVGGNFGPSLEPSSPRPLRIGDEGQAWIDVYRGVNNMPDLFGRPTWPLDEGTVAFTKISGRVYFGVNSGAPGYSDGDRAEANAQRWGIIDDYPFLGRAKNIGQVPFDSLYHAESLVLMRAAIGNGGSLAGKSIEVYTDREMCWSCEKVLPYLGLRLGNPIVTFIDRAGTRQTMWNGSWLFRGHE